MRAVALLAVLALGCGVKSKKTTYVDPDAYGAVEGTGLEARDVRAVADQMARELLASPSVTGFEGTPRVAVLPVKNRSRFLIDQDIFTTQITDMLVQNAAGKLAVLNREIVDQIMAERELKRSGEADAHSLTAVAGADFFLTGEVHRPHPMKGGYLCRYTWEQRHADPLTGMVTDVIHFRIEKAGVIEVEMFDAFVYEWRLWSVPELRDALIEAGFARTEVFAKLADAWDDEGNAYVQAVVDAEDELDESFIVLVAGRA